MAISNHERVGKAMELLKGGLGPFVEREFKSTCKDRAAAEAVRFLGEDRPSAKKSIAEKDVAALLKLRLPDIHFSLVVCQDIQPCADRFANRADWFYLNGLSSPLTALWPAHPEVSSLLQ